MAEDIGQIPDARRSLGKVPKKDPEFPNIEARNHFDFEAHVRKAMENGMSREEAEEHAREDMEGEHEASVDVYSKAARNQKSGAPGGRPVE